MKKLLMALTILFCGINSIAQIYVPPVPTVYGSNNNRVKAILAQHIPEKSDTTTNTTDTTAQIFLLKSDSSVWAYYKQRGFFKIGSGSGGSRSDSGLIAVGGYIDTITFPAHPGIPGIIVPFSIGDSIMHQFLDTSSGLTDGYFIKWNSAGRKWVLAAGSGTSSVSLQDAFDTSQFRGNVPKISTSSHTLDISGSTSGTLASSVFTVNNTSSSAFANSAITANSNVGAAIRGTTNGGYGVYGLSTTGIALQAFSSSSGIGLYSTSSSGQPLLSENGDPSNLISSSLRLMHTLSSAPSKLFGVKIEFALTDSLSGLGNNDVLSNSINSRWTDNADATRTSELFFNGLNSGTEQTLVTFSGNGALKFNKYSSAGFYHNDTTNYKPLVIDNSGNVAQGSWSTSGGTGSVTSVGTGYGLTGGTITTSGTIVADTTKLIPYTDTLKINGIATQTYVNNHVPATPNLLQVTTVGNTANSINLLRQFSATPPPAHGNVLLDSAGLGWRDSTGRAVFLNKSLVTAGTMVIDSFQNKSGSIALTSDVILDSVLSKGGKLSTNRNSNINFKNWSLDSTNNFKINSSPYLSFVANNNEALGVGYGAIPTTGTTLTAQNIFMLNKHLSERIRQTGLLTKIRFYMAAKPAQLTTLKFVVWRKSGSTYTKVSEEDVLTRTTTNAIDSITLNTPISVLEGDYTGMSWTASISISGMLATTSSTGVDSLNFLTSDPGSSSTWSSATLTPVYIPINCTISKSPVIVFMGNSIIAGATKNSGWISGGALDDYTNTIPYYIEGTLGVTGQNMGNGTSNQTWNFLQRFPTDVVASHPKFAVIEGGVNDVNHDTAYTRIISNWNAMLQQCLDAGIKPVIMLITPWTNGTNTQNIRVDSVNTYLISVSKHYNAIVADSRPVVGQFRGGGAVGNLWDMQSIYNDDGIHPNTAGKVAIAGVISSAIISASYNAFTVDSFRNTIIGNNLNIRNIGAATDTVYTKPIGRDSSGNVVSFASWVSIFPSIASLSGWSTLGNTLLNRTTNYLGSSDSSQVHIKTKATDAIIIDSTQKVGIGITVPAYKLDINGDIRIASGFTVQMPLTSGTNRNMNFFTTSPADNLSTTTFQNTAGNSQTTLSIIPHGTGRGTSQSAITFYNKDAIADGTNIEFMQIFAAGSEYRIYSGAAGTGTVRPIFIDATGSASPATSNIYFAASGRTAFGGVSATPTAVIHIKAGTATASTAPLKFTPGVVLTTPEIGAIETDSANLYVTHYKASSPIRYRISGNGLPTIAAGVGAGTTPTITVSGNDGSMQVSCLTGAAPTGTNAVIATITFNKAFGTSPKVVFSPANAATALLSAASMVYMDAAGSTTTYVITSGTTALTTLTTYLWNVIVQQ